MNHLAHICDYKKEELESDKRRLSLADVRSMARDRERTRDFFKSVTSCDDQDIAIIAEVKKASPSRGVIVSDFDPVRLARVYEDNGAAALSVLTDEHFFQGKLEHINLVKAAVALPVLRKDFTLHEYHIYQARAADADAILLITKILEGSQLVEYCDLATEFGMTTIIEVHDQADIDTVFESEALEGFSYSLIGINNRDLETFETDLKKSEELRQKVPSEIPVVSESGINTREDIDRLMKANINAFLIGESLLTAKDSGERLKSLLGRT